MDDFIVTHDETNDSVVKKPRESFKSSFFDWLDVIITSVVAVVLIFTFCFRVVTVDGDSMLNTLHTKEKIVISNVSYEPKQGDIVVVSRNIDNSLDSTKYEDNSGNFYVFPVQTNVRRKISAVFQVEMRAKRPAHIAIIKNSPLENSNREFYAITCK